MKKSLTLAALALSLFMIAGVSYAYTVKSGDTMYNIALSNNLSLSQLLALNPLIKNPSLIYPGQNVNTSSTATVAAQTTTATPKHRKSTYVKPIVVPVVPTTTITTTSTPVVTPTLTTTPTPVVGASGETMLTAYITGYGWPDNTPAGADISNPVIHSQAGGTGTFADPITVAVGHSIINGIDILDYKAGTKFYMPYLRKYFIAEDTCGDGSTPQNGPCHSGYQGHVWLDIWVGGVGANQSVVLTCEDAITDLHTAIINPASNYVVSSGAVYGTSCAPQFSDTPVTL